MRDRNDVLAELGVETCHEGKQMPGRVSGRERWQTGRAIHPDAASTGKLRIGNSLHWLVTEPD